MSPHRPRIAISTLSARQYGGDRYFHGFLPALKSLGADYEYLLLARNDDHRYDSYCSPDGPISLIRCTIPNFYSGASRILWEQARLPALLKNLAADLLYTANNAGVLLSPVPCVIAIRNMEPLVPPLLPASLGIRTRLKLLRWLTPASAKRAARVVAVSNYVRDTMVSLGTPDSKIDVVYHGIDDLPAPPPPSQRTAPRFMAASAKFVRYANLETLFKAFVKIRSAGYEGELRFAGGSYDIRYEVEIKKLVRDLHLEPYVKFLGYVSREQMHRLMADCDIFLFSSTLEACPFTFLEAMHCGSAVISSNSKPMPEFGADAAVYVPPTNADAFAKEALALLRDHARHGALKKKALARAELFTWRESVRQLMGSWERALHA